MTVIAAPILFFLVWEIKGGGVECKFKFLCHHSSVDLCYIKATLHIPLLNVLGSLKSRCYEEISHFGTEHFHCMKDNEKSSTKPQENESIFIQKELKRTEIDTYT